MAQKDFSGWSLFIILFMITVLPFFFFSPQKNQVPYSEFKQWLGDGKVSEVVISDKTIQGTRIESGKAQPFSTVRVDDPALIPTLESKKIKVTGEIQSSWLRDILLFWVLPTMVIIFIWSLIAKRAGGAGQSFMAFGRAHAKVFEQKDVKVSFEDVAGADEPKEELIEIIDFLRSPERFQRLGGKIPKGVLLVGPPGTGKTLLARAVAGEAKVPFFSMSGSEFVEMFVGVGAARVRDLFSQAQQKAPCIIFIDELDALGRARGSGMLGGHAEQDQTLNQLLVEMDGFDTRKGVIIMAATNRPEILDTALLRPGRFDRQILVDRPDIREREEILHVHTRGVKLDSTVDLKILAARTPGFVGADLANFVNEAALLAARKNKDQVEMTDFEEAINRGMAGLEKKKRVMSKKEKEFVAYHESGHALVAELVPNADRVHRISIIPRGIAALGYTLQLPTEERYLMTRNELLDRMAVLLGGRVAEEIVFGEASTGAQNDLTRATDIARSMVKEFGMSEKVGLVSFERQRRAAAGDGFFPGVKEYSEELAKVIDREVKEILDRTYDRVRNILEKNRGKLELLARLLLEKEVVEGEALRKIIEGNDQNKRPAKIFSPERKKAVGE